MTRSVQSVLVIEDEPILAKNIRTYLARYGYDVRVAFTAEDGLSELKAFHPDIILLDFNLPGMNGLEALPKIRAIDRHIKVIMMTAFGTNELAAKAMQAGACDFVTKPISVGKVRQMLEDTVIDERSDQGLS
jgi:DNA-binding NtrC family response regulator